MRRMEGEATCLSHSERGAEQRKRATEASAKARNERREAREKASEDAKMSLTERIRRDAAAKADEVSRSLVDAAIADGSSRAMAELLNRVEGKVTDSLNVNAGDPFTMSEAELHRWLNSPMTEGSTVSNPDDQGDHPGNGTHNATEDGLDLDS